uniref:ATP synthase CF0 B' chain subunit II n=1 Tax=Nitzschia sp. PL1-4 TaxID=2083272 RepID=A0A2Z5ZAN6_9STRA|nr:ATP synthase CF0 B' chain subunit II [Nitzschia sp. PL1-4]
MVFLLSIKGPNGLFDINGTLPLLGIHFLFLVLFLHSFLYKPLQEKKEQRNIYILNNFNNTVRILFLLYNKLFLYENNLNLNYYNNSRMNFYLEYIHIKLFNLKLKNLYFKLNNFYIYSFKKIFIFKKIYRTSIFLLSKILNKKIFNKLNIK